ncbi:hypothetical protein HETIRDRAFT_452783 [Heterobasidion irregulare TC 32-1]|uniref:Uncharacterized protein n=1 Tax=Heterobasidion irregulare (strain TC 32-1) TaxID=747525 RepID=W4K2U7_HETIT|nr:uncharacterized protein HETIRDRAFT_452783 [Heterobasidion irregulare TC 32-1]ETW79675.1 hypothetical protein HETIRDRAFT_452783 [Heterobasidion irregulare TC 32-1]
MTASSTSTRRVHRQGARSGDGRRRWGPPNADAHALAQRKRRWRPDGKLVVLLLARFYDSPS